MAETRILIVEDEDIVAGEIQSVLTHLGYPMAERVVSGEEALAAVETNLPDLVLMDITLQGGMDGIQAAELIHERFDLPVVYLTAHDDENTLQHAKVSDPFGYILKPFKQRELHVAIEIALYRHHTERRLRELNRQLQEVSQHKSDFLANMSHELRTPLNAILGYTQALQREAQLNTGQKVEELEIIRNSGEHLLTLINDLLDLARIEARKLELYPTSVVLPEFLAEVVKIIQMRTEPKMLGLHYAPLTPLPKSVMVDGKRLRQVLLNLLDNAVKFTQTGTITFRVSSDCQSVSDSDVAAQESALTCRVRFEVEDTGIGILLEDQEKNLPGI